MGEVKLQNMCKSLREQEIKNKKKRNCARPVRWHNRNEVINGVMESYRARSIAIM